MKNFKIYFFVLILGGIMLSSCNFEFTTANVKDIKICESLSGSLCNSDNSVLSTNIPEIYISCKLKNAPDNTKVTFTWKYLEEPQVVIDEVTLNSENKGTSLNLHSSLSRPNNGWPTGKYAVEISIGEDDKSPKVKNFEIR